MQLGEVITVVGVLGSCAYIIIGLLKYITNFTKSTNTEYRAVLKLKDKEVQLRLEAEADRDKWKLKAIAYSEQRQKAVDAAKSLRDRYFKLKAEVDAANASVALPKPLDLALTEHSKAKLPSESQIAMFDIEAIQAQLERDKASKTDLEGKRGDEQIEMTLIKDTKVIDTTTIITNTKE